jgi:hypothetical protein
MEHEGGWAAPTIVLETFGEQKNLLSQLGTIDDFWSSNI